ILSDMSGVYADLGGKGSVVAAELAVEDFGGSMKGKPIEIVSADHQNKPDIGSAILRDWFDNRGVDMVTDLLNSSVALSAIEIAKTKNRVAIVVGAATSRLTGDACTANSMHWSHDTYSWAYITAKAMLERGGDTWYFITTDYAFGHAMEKDAREVIAAGGGKVLGSSKAPLGTSDFSSFLISAESSGAKVIAIINSGADTINSVKQAAEFGISQTRKLAVFGVYITDIDAMGLSVAQNLVFTSASYWDRDDQTRAWSKRYFARMGKMPTDMQAGVYSSTLQYLKAVASAGTDETGAVMKVMKTLPVNDMFATDGKVRADGRMVHDMYLTEVKKPAESKYPWDYLKIVATIPGAETVIPLSKSACPLVAQSR
ncbi:ABC transporter substrate-binding protein, partial [Methylobacterium trifolii]